MHKRTKQQVRRSRRPALEEIEPRILYSADFAPALVPDASLDAHIEQRSVDSSGEFNQTTTQQAQASRHEIVFVDTATPDYEKLIADIRAQGSGRNVEVVLLDAGKDGVAQITKTLAGREDVGAVHIVSHGADGAVQLGNTSLDFNSLLKNGAKIKGWGAALSSDADILIYGCNVAETDSGRSLVDALARLTGADVAASDDLTGSATLGGDWDLEFHSGLIDTSIVFSQSVVLDWNGTLAGVTVGGETKANTSTGAQDTNSVSPPRSVAVDANGNYVVVWSGNGTGDANGVFFQRYDANGTAQGGETRINQSTGFVGDTQDSPAVSMDASGNFVVVWRSNNQDGSGTGIYARRYNAAGTALANEFRVNTTTANGQDNPNIAMNASGAFVVTWTGIGQAGDPAAGVYARRYNAAGTALDAAEFRVNTTTAGDQWSDSVAMDAAGNFVVTFSSADAGGAGVWMRRFNASGTALSGEVRINSTTAGDQGWSSVAMAADGDYVVAWRSVGQDGDVGGIYAQRYNASGVAQGGEFRVNTTTANEQAHPAVAMDINGNFMVVWQSEAQGVDGAGVYSIFKQEYNADGTANGGEVRVNNTAAGNQQNPALAMNAVGQAVVAWAGNGPGDGDGVFYQRYATALVVDTTSNTYDSGIASGTVTIGQLVNNRGTDGKISLREAIFAANNTANANANSPDRIYFNIPGSGTQTINVTSQLPFITGTVLIDGTTQTGYASTPLVELDGQGTVAEGLYLDTGSGGSTIKGLVINRFQWAIDIAGSSNNLVVGNFLGTNATGTAAKGNWVGVWLGTSNNTVGGTTAADRNIISGNTIDGVQISGSGGGTGNVVIGNYIGVDVTGTVDLGNTAQGIALYNGAKNNIIGGTTAGARNVISGNNGEGVRLIHSGTTGNVIIGNYIGTNAAGTAAIANNKGVWIDTAAASNTIGGTAAGAGNTIAYNTLDGVVLTTTAGAGNAILGNSIHSNGDLGIDLSDNGVTPNDGAKTAGQPNLLMDFPAVQTTSLNGTSLMLAGYIGTAPGDTDFAGARVEFFKSTEAAGTNGEGQVYLGFLTADASGNFSGTLTVSGVALGDRITATATDGSNNTSEFAVNTTVVGGAPVATNDAYSVNEDGTLTVPGASNWWNTSWSQRKQLTFNNTGQAENLTNFAVLVELDNTRINYALTQNAGQDLRFVDSDGTLLAHEIETWNESGTSYVWVSVPQIDASSGSDYIWMYYGNASAPDTQNPDAVWDPGFTGVWHLNTNEQDSAGTNDGINSNSTNGAGVIASGQSFNGTNAQVYTTTQFNNPQQYTVEAWFRTTQAGGKKIIGFENDQTGTATTNWDRELYIGTDGRLYFGAYYAPTDSEDVANSATTYTDGAWHYAVGVRNDATDTLSLYVDGVLVDTSANAAAENYAGYWRLAGYKQGSGWPNGADGYFNGSIDEARVSNQVRSAAWVKAQYLSMTDTFVSVGATQGMGVLNNDTDPNGDALTSVLVSGPSNAASFTLNANGSFTYTPTANFAGTDTFTYRANDGTNNSNLATVTITVNPVNDAPTATITPATYAATEQTSLTLHGTGLSIADVDAASGTLTATLSVVSGTLTVTAGTTGAAVSGSGTNSVTLTGTLTQINNLLAGNLGSSATYVINSDTPPATDTLTLGVNDGGNTGSGGAKTGSDTATINISAVNDAPTATITPATYSATEQASLTLHGTGLAIADVDAGSASVTATLSVVSGTLTVTAGTTGAAVSGSGTNSVTLTGTLTQINNLLAGNGGATASYIISSDTPPATDTLTLLANDGGNTGSGGAKTGSDTATINISAVNDAPTATITPVTYPATEQTSLTLHGTGLSIADVDAGTGTVTATLSVASGTLTVAAGTTGAAVSGSGTNSVTLTGTLTQINNLLAGNLGATATYIINSDTPPATDTLTLLVNDGGNTGSGGAKTGTDTATINISAVNDAPTATITPATYSATEQTSLTLHGTGLSIADVDAGSASVTATLSVVSGTLTVTAGTTGAAVSGSGTNSVTLTGTLTQINNLLAGNLGATATYIINSDTPPATDTLTLGVNDGGNTGSGGAKTGSDTATINIGAVNDAPAATITPATYAATEQTSLTLHGTGLSIADVDAGSASVSATLSVVSGTLTVTAGTTGAAVSGSGTNSVTLTGTLTQINNLLAGNLGATASYINNSDAPAATDTLTLSVNDGGNTGSGGAQSGSDTATINISAVNDAPTATITPATYSATEQTSLTLHGTGLSIADVDAGSSSVTATLSVVSGTLTVTAGTTGAAVSGSGTNSVTLTGTLTQINNLLAGNLTATLTYSINSDTPPASDTLTLGVNDGGNTGSGGAKTGSDTATINISAVNDAPTATITPATYSATEQTSLTLHGTGLAIADVDAGSSSVTATLSVVSGTLTVTAGTTGAAVSGSGTNSVTLTGTLAQINNLLAGNGGATASYSISSDTPPASDTLTLSVNDGGNTGSGGVQTGSDTATINVAAVNDAPVNTVPAAQGTTRDVALVFSSGNGNAISVADVDAGASLVQVTLTATNGTVSLPSLTGLTVMAGANGSATITVRGNLATLNTRLDGLTFNPTAGYDGPASLAIATNDLGNTGAGGALLDNDTISITVNPPSTPNASNDAYGVNEDASLPVGPSVLSNDTDPPGNGLTAVLVSGPSSAAAFVLNANGTFTYTPNANFHGTDTFTYYAQDGAQTSNVATVTITVNSVNDAPTGADKTVSTTEDTPYTFSAADFTFGDGSDTPANALLAVKIVGLPGAGALKLAGSAVSAGQSIAAADITAGLLQFTPTVQANGAGYASFTFQVQDDGGTANSGVDTDPVVRTMTIDVSAVNDAPTATIAAGSYGATEQVSLALHGTGLSIGDVDAGSASLTATLSVVSGTLTVNAGTTGVVVGGSGGNSVTLTGTLAQINDLLAGNLGGTASYIINSDTPPASDTLSLSVNDGGNTGSGGAQIGSASAAINIGAVNDAPTATITPATYAATEQVALVLHGTGLSIADADAGGASVTATLSVASGSLTVSAGGTGVGVAGSGTNSVTLTGTLAQINDLLAGNLGATATYIIGSDAPPASDTLILGVNDGGNTGSGGTQVGSDSATINIAAVNDAPTATIAAGSYSATEQVGLALHGTGLSIGDVDAGSASLTATLSVVSGTLTVNAGTTGVVVGGSGGNSVTLTGTLAQINDLLAGNLGGTASYIINSDTPPPSDTLSLSVNDAGNTGSGGAQSGSANVAIAIGAVNDAPTATITPATYSATEQTSLTLHGTGLSIADPDAGSADVTATLSVVSGALTVTAGTTGVTIGGSGTNSVTLTGTLAQINDLLAGNLGATAVYAISSDAPPATDTLTLSVDDEGNSGSGGAQSGSDTAIINIAAVNDAPTATIAAGSYGATEQVSLALHGTGLSIGDVDAGSASLTATLSVVSGTLTVNAGTTGVVVGGSGGNSVTLTGTLAQINDLLAGNLGGTASYIINSDTPPASDTLSLSVNDGGNTGSGGAQIGSASAAINIGAVNDAPTATITPATYAATEQVALVLHGTGLSIADADAGGADITATLSVVAGALSVTAGTTGVTIGGSGTDSVTLTGTLAQINDLLAGNLGASAIYIMSSEAPPATDTLTLSVNDGGNAGSGGAHSGSDSAAINIAAVNDAPVATIGAASYVAAEQTALVLSGTGLSVGDADAGTAAVTATVSVASGTLSAAAGTTGVSIAGNGTNSLTLTGTLTQINDLLAGASGGALSYLINSDTPPANDTLTLSVNDGGNSGSGGAQSGSANVTINIAAVNDAPTATIAAGSYAATEQINLALEGTGLSIADVDAGAGTLTANLSVVSGTLDVNAGTSGVIVAGSGSGSVTLTGTLAQINNLLAGNFGATASYVINSDTPPASDTLTLSVDDGGNSGSGGAQTASASVTIGITAVNDAPTGAVGIVGIAVEDTVLTADTSGIGDADGLGAFTYQWARSTDGGTSWGSIGGATAATYTLGDADVDALIQVSVSYTDGQGTAESVTSASLGPVANVNDAPSGAVVVTGTVTEDQTLTADTSSIGDADGLGGFTYQWARSTDGGVTWNDITSATASTYVLGDADVGNLIQVSVGYTDGEGSVESLTSAGVGPVANVNDAPTGMPTISGTVSEDQTLTADTSSIADVDGLGAFSYQWLRNGAAIGGATAGTYTLGDADVGTQISVQVSYTDGYGTLESLTSAQTAAVVNVNDAPSGVPTITGTPTEDQILTADASGVADADGLGAFSYQWLRDGVAIGGATAGTYALGDADVGTQISVQVSYTDGNGTAESVTSGQTAPVANVNDAPAGLPTISGTVTEDQMLTADTAGISDADGLGAFSYQWLRNGVAIGGATAGTYTLGDADVSTQISVRVSYTDGYGTAESVTSAQTAAVGNVNDAPTGGPTIAGTPTEDQTLTADTSGIADADGLGAFSYQWLRDGVAIGGATAGTFTLGDADVGTQISVQVSYTDAHGSAESLTSAQTAPVGNVNDAPTGVPTIGGIVTEDQTLTANTAGIGDADGLGAFSYQWLRDGVAIGGATAGTYTLGDADVGTQISVQVSYVDAHGTAESLTSGQTAPVANVNDAPTGAPTISGTATEDQILTADTSGIGDADGLGTFSYQWLRNGVAIGGAIGGTYTLGDADVGAQISVQVSYTDGQGAAESLTSTQTAPVANVNDAPAGVPTISGTVTEDQTLTADTSGISDADGLGAFSYQWLRNGVAIGGATAGTYTLGDVDVGTQVSVRVSYTDAHGTAESLTSAQTAPVANVNDTPAGVPTISGTVTEDQTLTADTSGISDADGLGAFGYQWLRNGVAIGGATAGTYTLGDADVGTQISVQVSYTDGYGTAESLTSAQTAPVANVNDAPVGLPAVSGTPTENQVLSADTSGISDADGLGAFGYVWLRDGIAIGGATAGTYTLSNADVGTRISVQVSYTDGHGTAESLTSAQTALVGNVNDPPTGVPTISGTATEDQVLTADTSGIADADGLGAFSYQWLRNGVAIGGATGGTYTLGDADVGMQVSVQVSYTDGQGTAESLTSAQTAAVVNINDAPLGVPVVGGTPTEDQVLTADTSGVSDADGLGAFSYQWLRNGAAIGGATSATYTLGDIDVGTQISVQVSYIDGHGTAESLTSAQTAPVANVNDTPAGVPSISGTPTEDQILTADTSGISDADGLGAFSYQWLRNGVAIGGATGGTYTLGDADVGNRISVRVNYTDGHATPESLTSVQTAPVANVNDAPTGAVTIAGTWTEDQTLTADTSSIADADGLGAFSYQWLRNGVAIAGAGASTYVLGDADVGSMIQVSVAYSDGHGSPESLVSPNAGPVANIDDAPVLGTNTLTIGNGNTLVISAANLSASDIDSPVGTLTFSVSALSHGRFELTSAPGVAITSFTQAEVLGGQVMFVHDGSRLAPSYAVRVSDGTLGHGPLAAGVSFDAGAIVIVPTSPPTAPVTNPAPAQAKPAAPAERPASADAVAPVVPALYSPGRVDPPEAQFNQMQLQPLNRQKAMQPVASFNHFEAGPYIDPALELLAAAPANLQYLSTVPVDWHVRSAFPESEEAPKDRIDVLLEQVQLGGMALSVGVVWWASRVSGLLGSLLASAPAWRHIDPLPVVGRDEEEDKKWYDPDDRDADANELAIANVLEGAQAQHGTEDRTERG